MWTAQIWPPVLWFGKVWCNIRSYFCKGLFVFLTLCWTQCNYRAVLVIRGHMILLMPIEVWVNWIKVVGFASVWDRNCYGSFLKKGLRHLWCPSVFALTVSRGGHQLRNSEFIWFSFTVICLLIEIMVTLWLHLLISQQVTVEGEGLQKTIFFRITPV